MTTRRIDDLDLRAEDKKKAGADLDEFGIAFEFPAFPVRVAEFIERRQGERRAGDRRAQPPEEAL